MNAAATMMTMLAAVAMPHAARQAPAGEERRANDAAVSLMALATGDRADGQAPALPDGWRSVRCTRDGLIYADTARGAVKPASAAIRLTLKGARLRDIAKLTLPCGFDVDPRSGWTLIATDGRDFRRYEENNPFGFAPAFGVSGGQAPFALRPKAVVAADIRRDDCLDAIRNRQPRLDLCAGFGSTATFFGARRDGKTTLIAHYVVKDDVPTEDFGVAQVSANVQSLFFLPPPDAPGGTITVILKDDGATYRAYIDVPRG